MINKTEKLNKIKKIKRGKNGGRRKGAGRKPKKELLEIKGIKEKIEQHIQEEVTIRKQNKQTGETTIEKKSRVLVLLEMLYTEGYERKNISAAKEWLDRGLGKAPQSIEHDFNAEKLADIERTLRGMTK